MNPERVILFDVDGVLVNGYHFNKDLRRCWDEHLEADLGITRHLFFEKFISRVFVNEVLTGKKALITALDETLPELGYAGSAMDIAAYWLARDSHLNHGLLQAISKLSRRHLKLYVATNQDHLRAMYLWQTLGLRMQFDDIFYSARLGTRKPDAAFFARVNEIIGPQTTPPLMFDDTPDVVDAAKAAGWDAVIYHSEDDFLNHPFIKTQLTE